MPNTDYVIESQIVVKDAATAGLSAVERRIAGIERQAAATGRSIFSHLSTAFALVGGAAGIGMVTRGFIGLQAQMQNAQTGIASLLSAIDHTPITQSMQEARGVMQGIRKDAAAGVGEFQDYLEGFQSLLGAGRQAGASNDAIRTLTKNAIASGFVTGVQGSEGARNMVLDVQQAMQGTAGVRNTKQLNILLQSIGVSTTALNAAKPEKRLELINKALATMAPGAAEMGKTWTAQWDTFKDNLRGVILTAGRPLFDHWTDQLRAANQWFVRNSDALAEMADRWAPRLVEMWDSLIAKAGTYAAIVAGAGVASGLSAAGGAGSVLRGAGMRAVGAVGGAGPMLALAAAFLAVKGAIADYPSILGFTRTILGELGRTFAKLGTSLSMLTTSGSALNMVGAALLHGFNSLLMGFDFGLRVVSSLVTVFGMLFNVIGAGLTAAMALMRGDTVGAAVAMDQSMRSRTAAWEQLGSIWAFGNAGRANERVTDEERNGSQGMQLKGAKQVYNTNLNGPITIVAKTEVNEDPARVAYVMGDVLEGLGRYRQQARRIPRPA